jgi:hypothetical protein
MTLFRNLPRMASALCACALLIGVVAPSDAAQAKKRHKPALKKKAAPAKAPAKVVKKAPVAPLLLGPMVGTWTLRQGDKERLDTKIVFRPNGTFLFTGSNFRSEGTYEFIEHAVTLKWTSVDGEPVAKDAMRKTLPLAEGEASFNINQFTYGKRG